MSYSDKARDPRFRAKMRAFHEKRIKGQRVKMTIYLSLLIVSVGVLAYVALAEEIGEAAAWLAVVAFASLPLFLIIAVIHARVASKFKRRLRQLDEESYECLVVDQSVKAYTYTDYSQVLQPTQTKLETKLALQRPDGTIEKFNGDRASMAARVLRPGDRVRYHPGFEYPIEPIDKSNGSICVFCGLVNDQYETNCKRCKQELL